MFLHDGARLYCDSAWFYSQENRLDAFGDVKIKDDDGLNITANFLRYIGKTQVAILTGDVVLKDEESTLYTDQLTYNRKEEVGYYSTGGRLIDPENKLYSKKGTYYSQTNTAYFKDSVVLENVQYDMYGDTLIYNSTTKRSDFVGPTEIISKENKIYCTSGWYNTETNLSAFYNRPTFLRESQELISDTLTYNRNIQYSKAWGDVELHDTAEGLSVFGAFAERFGGQGYSIVTGKPVLAIATESDSLYIHSDTFRLEEDSLENKELYAFTGVRMYQSEMQGVCDTLHYVSKDSMLYLLGDPMLWSSENQLSSKFMKALFYDGEIRKLYMDVSAFMVNADTLDYYNQVKGLNMIAYFKDNELHKIDVEANAESVYFARDEDEELVGLDYAKAARLKIYMVDKEINRVIYYQQIESNLKPDGDFSAMDVSLKDFYWNVSERPKSKADIFNFDQPESPSDSLAVPPLEIKDSIQTKPPKLLEKGNIGLEPKKKK